MVCFDRIVIDRLFILSSTPTIDLGVSSAYIIVSIETQGALGTFINMTNDANIIHLHLCV